MPNFLKPYFWDVDFSNLSLDKNKDFVISRILEKGRIECIQWLFQNFSKDEILRTVELKFNMSQETINLTLALID
jgi:hypothetical protein